MADLTIMVRFLLYLDLMLLFGIAAFSLYALRDGERVSGAIIPLRSLTTVASLLGALLSLLGLAALSAGLARTSLFALDRETLDILLFGMPAGAAWQLRIIALAVAFLAAWPLGRPGTAAAGATVVTVAGGAALGSLAWGGHGVAGEGSFGWVQLASDILHLLAAGLWVGALAAMVMLVWRPAGLIDRDHLLVSQRALAGFSTMGTIVVATLIVTGTVNLLGTAGWTGIPTLATGRYGQLLLAKLVLFVAMLALAAGNRFQLVPRFKAAMIGEDCRTAIGVLRFSLAVETGCALLILAFVAWLGTLDAAGAG